MKRIFLGHALVLTALAAAILVFSARESQAQVAAVSGGWANPGYGYGYGGYPTVVGAPWGYSGYASRSYSTFGLGGFNRSRGQVYSSYYGAPGVVVYPVPAYGYGYPSYGYGYGGGYGWPQTVPGMGYGPSIPATLNPGAGISITPGARGALGAEAVHGGTYMPGFGVIGGRR